MLVGTSWWSAEFRQMEWHYRSGLAICVLVLFRLIWGFVGTETSRFARFVREPREVFAYALGRSGAFDRPGHNPLGGWSVVALVGLTALQVALGFFAVDVDGMESGPLSYLVDFDQGRTAAGMHALIFDILLVLIALHILAVAFYLLVKRRNLITPMITGYAEVPAQDPVPQVRRAPVSRAIAALCVATFVTYALSQGLGFQ